MKSVSKFISISCRIAELCTSSPTYKVIVPQGWANQINKQMLATIKNITQAEET